MNEMTITILILFLIPIVPLVIYISGNGNLASKVSIGSGLIELLLTLYLIVENWNYPGVFSTTVLQFGEASFIEVGYWLNNYSLSLLLTVALISFAIRVYSSAYMKNDDRSNWFMVLIAFFTFAMYGIVLMPSLLSIFFFWEWVGLASYLMIGFWYQKPEAAQAAKKAFLYNKIGDLGLIMALGILYFEFGTFQIPEILDSQQALSGNSGLLFSAGIFIAAIAKSAQLPFSVWLPDAMEGPTPASALIHSATMVTAGVYILLRVFPLLDPLILDICLVLGTITAIWSGLAALSNMQIKKILAYSTISQLGFMMIGIGSSNPDAGFFHLVTHAFFKTSLFLGAGLIIKRQASLLKEKNELRDSQDIRYMKGHFAQSPLLAILFSISALALAGVPFFSGFLSKEAILSGLESNLLVLVIVLIASVITALYSGKLIFSVFDFRGWNSTWNRMSSEFKEQPSSYLPISFLSILSFGFLFSGWLPVFENSWLYNSLQDANQSTGGHFWLLIISAMIALIGLGGAYYLLRIRESEILSDNDFLAKGFFVDRFSYLVISKAHTISISVASWIETRILERIISFFTYSFVFSAMIARLLDQYVVDGSVRGVGYLSSKAGDFTRNFQGGNIRSYLFWLVVFILIGAYLIL